MNKLIKIPFDKQKGTAATLCIVCTVFIVLLMTSGCSLKGESESSFIDDAAFLKRLHGAPVALVSKDVLPEWLQEMIMEFEGAYENDSFIQDATIKIYKGEWENLSVYTVQHPYSSCITCLTANENGESFLEYGKVKNWVLIYQIGGASQTRSGLTAYSQLKSEDKYEFPDISGMNDWEDPCIIQKRLDALQIPDAVLVSISTAGLLETCLEFPYLLDIN